MSRPAFYPVILAGGSGERFWPLSRKAKPKQFLTLDDSGFSLLQRTAQRLRATCGSIENIFVVTCVEHRALVLDQLPELAVENLIVEPTARDTAPAVLYAALKIAQLDPDGVMGVFASDHLVANEAMFARVIERAREAAQREPALVTLGITPTYPATGYGYIERGETRMDGDLPVYAANRFLEKPDRKTAESLVASERYCWNSGMFVWSIQAILAAYRTHQPEMYERLSSALSSREALREVFPTLEKISVDYAILEKAHGVQVIPAEFGWDDLGDWNALERLLRGANANVAVGRHVGLDTDGAIVYTSGSGDLIATIGLEDVVVVRTHEVTLVVRKERTQDIKKVVANLKAHPDLARFV